VYYCPYLSCERHTRGFPRKYNLVQHQRKCHGDQQSLHTHTIRGQAKASGSSLDLTEHESIYTELGSVANAEIDGESGTDITYTTGDSYPKGEDRMRHKLRFLKAQRAEMVQEFDRDIATMERALSLMGEYSN
jgi:hypothetical protein